ncbi:hypothetical protein R7D97_16105 [Vibrio sp. Vb5031]|uniref:Uncharacterized protein n=2 Tax=Vibrio TaxID=662 RepID=A0A1B1LRT0_VIBPH|nr:MULTISPECIES: hypothetical protein [Vibrio]ANS55758.1 hypothetical protein [Vibrio parahaemolyticus]EJL6492162.1 hypothetical protein [Vibrio cholerae]EJL6644668.1 hypothetical protein [Vibrio cholerae]MCI9701769.1 hypothetical protein [Vibrio parahaemolyticus]MCR9815713.1 hypothetical protein [Vibrio parahaemolyticus]
MKLKSLYVALLATSTIMGCSTHAGSTSEEQPGEKEATVISAAVEAKLEEVDKISPTISRTIKMVGLKRENECGVPFTEAEIMNIGQTNSYFGFFTALTHIVSTSDLDALYNTAEQSFDCDNAEWIKNTKTSMESFFLDRQKEKQS